MRFTFTIEIEVERIEGKFAARDEIADYLREEIEGANPSTVDSVGADGETTYEITEWDVDEQPQPKRQRRPRVTLVDSDNS